MSDDPASIEAWQQQMRDDIVTRLRSCSSSVEPEARLQAWYWLPKTANEAADEIERLHRKLLGEENAYDILRLENERLSKERDEARRSYCYATGNGEEQRAINIAQSKGWDCFKEGEH